MNAAVIGRPPDVPGESNSLDKYLQHRSHWSMLVRFVAVDEHLGGDEYRTRIITQIVDKVPLHPFTKVPTFDGVENGVRQAVALMDQLVSEGIILDFQYHSRFFPGAVQVKDIKGPVMI